MKKFLPTAAVLGLLALLGSYVLLFESKPADPKAGVGRLYRVKQADITRILLEYPDKGSAIVLEKQADGSWWIAGPLARLETEGDAVTAILETLSAPEMERRMGPSDPAAYGLDHPTFRAAITLKNGRTRSFIAGIKNPSETAYFAQLEGSREACMIPAPVVDGMRKSPVDLRSRTPAPLDPSAVTRVVVHRSTDTMEFNRSGKESWVMTRPGRGDADRYAVEGLLNSARAIKGTDIFDEPGAAARYRLDDPTVRIDIYSGKGETGKKPLSISLSRPTMGREDAYVLSSRLPFVMRIAGNPIVTDATKPSDDYRERSLLAANKDDLKEAVIKYQGKEYTIRRGFTGRLSVVKPSGIRADEAMNNMLFEIIYVRVEKFISDQATDFSRYGLSSPAAEITVAGKKDGARFRHTYTLGARNGGFTCLRWNGGKSVYGVRNDLLGMVAAFAGAVAAPARPSSPKKPGTPGKK